jgi:putative transposase
MKHGFMVWAYVIMPNHAHFLIHPTRMPYSVGNILRSIKQPVAQIALQEIARRSPLLSKKLTLPSGKLRFWQAGGGFDRNL